MEAFFMGMAVGALAAAIVGHFVMTEKERQDKERRDWETDLRDEVERKTARLNSDAAREANARQLLRLARPEQCIVNKEK